MKTRFVLLFSILFLMLVSASLATPIWDNGTPDQGPLFGSEPGGFPNTQVGDDFTLGATATLGQIQWWGGYFSANTPTTPDNFTIRFYTITAGVPSTVVLLSYNVGNVGRVDSGLDSFGDDIYVYSATIPDTILPAGQYLLSIVNDTTADTDDQWGWATSNQNAGAAWLRDFDAGPWQSYSAEFAFNISGPVNGNGVPDTGTSALLFTIGLAALFLVDRRLNCRCAARLTELVTNSTPKAFGAV